MHIETALLVREDRKGSQSQRQRSYQTDSDRFVCVELRPSGRLCSYTQQHKRVVSSCKYTDEHTASETERTVAEDNRARSSRLGGCCSRLDDAKETNQLHDGKSDQSDDVSFSNSTNQESDKRAVYTGVTTGRHQLGNVVYTVFRSASMSRAVRPAIVAMAVAALEDPVRRGVNQLLDLELSLNDRTHVLDIDEAF